MSLQANQCFLLNLFFLFLQPPFSLPLGCCFFWGGGCPQFDPFFPCSPSPGRGAQSCQHQGDNSRANLRDNARTPRSSPKAQTLPSLCGDWEEHFPLRMETGNGCQHAEVGHPRFGVHKFQLSSPGLCNCGRSSQYWGGICLPQGWLKRI